MVHHSELQEKEAVPVVTDSPQKTVVPAGRMCDNGKNSGRRTGGWKMSEKRAVLSVNTAVLLFGLAGLFARWIHLPASVITFGRVAFSAAALGLFLLAKKQSFRLRSSADAALLALAGAVLAVHWWSFLRSVQVSTVAVATVTFSSFPLFVTLLEPVVFRRRPERKSILLALVILIGAAVTTAPVSSADSTFAGALLGLLSALTYAVLTVMNSGFSERYSATLIAFCEQSCAAVLLLPAVFTAGARPSAGDVGLLLILGVVTTAVAHTLFISSLQRIPARLAGICSSLETVYGILFALILLGEVPSVREILGAVIIVGAVVTAQLLREKPRKRGAGQN